MHFDFHLHTTMSDGKATPEALVWKASARNLDVIAVTDHDTTAGVAAARAEGHEMGVRVLSGVELSAQVPLPGGGGKSVHLICLGFDEEDAALQAMLSGIRAARVRASNETLEALRLAGYGAELPPGLVIEGRSLCRPHLADALVKAGRARTRNEAFDLFLSSETYRSHYDLPSAEIAIATVHRAGGVAVYAHPEHDEIDRVAPLLKEWGVDGIEVFRAARPNSPRSLYAEDMAKRLSLLTCGGSDWHGMGGVLGAFFLTEEQVGPLVRKVT
jgi:predicted metal-dependent phosphoesterase TrpH